jgi:hypothetical protein
MIEAKRNGVLFLKALFSSKLCTPHDQHGFPSAWSAGSSASILKHPRMSRACLAAVDDGADRVGESCRCNFRGPQQAMSYLCRAALVLRLAPSAAGTPWRRRAGCAIGALSSLKPNVLNERGYDWFNVDGPLCSQSHRLATCCALAAVEGRAPTRYWRDELAPFADRVEPPVPMARLWAPEPRFFRQETEAGIWPVPSPGDHHMTAAAQK